MPSSPEATPMLLELLAEGAPDTRSFTLPAFETKLPTAPSVRSFALAGSATIPTEVLAAATAAATASGRASGYAQGWAEGLADARIATEQQLAAEAAAIEQRATNIEKALSALGAAAQSLRERAVVAATDIEEQIIAAAWAIATALVGDVLIDDDRRGRSALARALALAPSDEDVRVSVSPEDFQVLATDDGSTSSPGVISRQRGTHIITITPDPDLAPGDATAQSGATFIDARLSTAIDRVRGVLAQ